MIVDRFFWIVGPKERQHKILVGVTLTSTAFPYDILRRQADAQ